VVQLDADPRSIGRITTAVGEAAGTVAAVDVVESGEIFSTRRPPAVRTTG
jgi:hypothetical protein